jgi:IPT/TIG domain
MMLMKNCIWMLLPILLLYGCGSRSEPETEREKTSAAASITNVSPAVVIAGKSFYVNAKAGLSTLGVSGAGLKPNSRVRIGSQALTTDVRKDGTFAAALVPEAILSTPGKYDVVVEQPDGGLSNVLAFTVLATTGPAPVVDKLFPAGTMAGQGFNVQPAGGSALGISGSNFRPDAKVLFGTKELDTVYGNTNGLSAWVPPALFATPGVIEVKVRNSDGKLSEPRPFKVTARP